MKSGHTKHVWKEKRFGTSFKVPVRTELKKLSVPGSQEMSWNQTSSVSFRIQAEVCECGRGKKEEKKTDLRGLSDIFKEKKH